LASRESRIIDVSYEEILAERQKVQSGIDQLSKALRDPLTAEEREIQAGRVFFDFLHDDFIRDHFNHIDRVHRGDISFY